MTSDIRYVPVSPEHADGLLELWNAELGAAFPLRRELLMQNSFGRTPALAAGSHAAYDGDGRLAGFALCKGAGPDTGAIGALLVRRDCRRRGIGGELLDRAERALRREGARTIRFGGEPNHYVPGVPSEFDGLRRWLASRRGYRHEGAVCDLIGDFSRAAPPELAASRPDGVSFAAIGPAERDALLWFLAAHFPGRWERSAADCFAAGGTGREYVGAWKDGGLIGFCRINDDDSPVIAANTYWNAQLPGRSGGIGPLGIAPAFRGRGWGLAVVQAGLSELLGRGCRYVVIDWTTHLDFYAKLGFRPWKRYEIYARRLEV